MRYLQLLLLWVTNVEIPILYSVDSGVPTRRAFFGEGIGPVHLSRAECTSEDMNLLNCTIDKTAADGCDHSEDAGVICSGMYKCIIMIV